MLLIYVLLFPNIFKITVFMVRLARSLKYSCFPIQPCYMYLGPLEGAMKLTVGCLFSLASLEAWRVRMCSPAWILSPEPIPPTIDAREEFPFPSISVMSSSRSRWVIGSWLVYVSPLYCTTRSLLSFSVFPLLKLLLGSWWEPGGY